MPRDARAHVAPSTAGRHRSAVLATMPRCWRGSRALPAGARYRHYSASTYLACRRPAGVASPPPAHRIFTTPVGCRRPRQLLPSAHVPRRIYLVGGGKQQPETSGAPRSAAAAGAAVLGQDMAASAHTASARELVAARPATQSSPSGERGRTRTPRADLAATVPFRFYRMPPCF